MRGFDVVMKAGIVHEGRLLVMTPVQPERRHEHDLPGGQMERGEHPLTALRREVREETGLDIEPVAPVRAWTFFRADGTQVVGMTWACLASSASVRLSEEHVSYRWVGRTEIPPGWPERAELMAVFQTIDAFRPAPAGSGVQSVDGIAGQGGA